MSRCTRAELRFLCLHTAVSSVLNKAMPAAGGAGENRRFQFKHWHNFLKRQVSA